MAWEKVCKKIPDAVLIVAGPDDNNYRTHLDELISDYKLSEKIIFTGMVTSLRKWEL